MLKRICRCGIIIDYSQKYCDKCTVIAEQHKSDRNKYYDENIRNKESSDIYHSSEWQQLTQECKSKFKAIDVYSLYVNDILEFGSLSHHIEEVTKNKARAFDLTNLIWLTSDNHTFIHKLYRKDYEGTKKMLFELVDRFNKQYGGNYDN